MRILFVGTVNFSRHCLEEILKNANHEVAVITLAPERAGFHSDYADLSEVALQRGLPCYKIKNINEPQNIDLIKSLEPDVIFVFGWSQLISREILEIPPLGCVGTHPALLPRNRGRHPIVWALVEGLRESGLTFFYLDEGADSGDILWQKPFEITLEDDAGSLYKKIELLAGEAIAELLASLERGEFSRRPQDHGLASYWRRRTEKDGEIDWGASTMTIYNLVRALRPPYVGAHTYAAGQKVKVWRAIIPDQALPEEAQFLQPGAVFRSSPDGLEIRTGDGYIKVSEYQAPGSGAIEAHIRLGAGSGK